MSSSQQIPDPAPEREDRERGPSNPILAVGLFVRQVIAELKKVVVPTRKELIVYSITVLVFVIMMILFIFGLDFVFGAMSRATFVDPSAGL